MDLLYKIFIDPFVQMGQAPDLLVQTLWEGLVAGVLYSLIALGFVLIFKASGVFNFAQGIMVVFAALTLVGLYALLRRWCVAPGDLAAYLALLLTIGVMFVLAVADARCARSRTATRRRSRSAFRSSRSGSWCGLRPASWRSRPASCGAPAPKSRSRWRSSRSKPCRC